MTEPRTRKRLVRRAFTALAVAVLLVGGYISSYLGMYAAFAANVIDEEPLELLERTVFAPLHAYSLSDLPGGDHLFAARMWLWSNGEIPLSEFYYEVDESDPSDADDFTSVSSTQD